MSASFSSKQHHKDGTDIDDAENAGQIALAPGIVNYTESVLSSAVISEANYAGQKQIEPALQQQMDQLRNKLTRYLNVKKE